MSNKIERDFTAHGLRCVVLASSRIGHRCGYVGVPKNHLLYGLGYGEGSATLKAAWDRAKEGPIGKRGIIPLLCSSDDELPRADCVFDVHGGLTYSGGNAEYPAPSDGLWWFGFDCGHAGDVNDPELMDESLRDFERKYRFVHDGEVRTEEYVAAECKRLAEQLAQFSKSPSELERLVGERVGRLGKQAE